MQKKKTVIVHGVCTMGKEKILANGQFMIAHIEEYLKPLMHPDFCDFLIDKIVLLKKNAYDYLTLNLGIYYNIRIQWRIRMV